MNPAWLKKEIQTLVLEKKTKLSDKEAYDYDMHHFKRLSIILIILLFFSSGLFGGEQRESFFWGQTWRCSNENCGYDNYEGINYCGLCGTPR